MNFKEILLKAKSGNKDAVEMLLEMYKPLLFKEAIVDGIFDEDLYQEIDLTTCVEKRISQGGTSIASVDRQIAYVKDQLK